MSSEPRKSRRVLQVVRPAAGGIRQHVLTLLEHVDRERFLQAIAAPIEFLRSLPHDVVSLTYTLSIAPRFSPVQDLVAARQLRRLISRSDLVHAQGLRAAWIAALAHLCRPFPFVVTAHNLVQGDGAATRVGTGLIGARASKIIAVSRAVSEGLMTRGVPPSKILVIPNGIDLDHFRRLPDRDEARQELSLDPARFVVGCIARLSPEKGLDILLDAALRLPDVFFVVAGEGPERARLTEALPQNVRLLGRVADTRSVLAAVDVLAIPSRQEGQGIVALEAMAAGVPLAASRIGGLAEMLTDGETALLVPTDDPSALSDVLSRLREDAALREYLVARAGALVEKEYGLQRMLAAVEGVYEAALV